MSEAGLLLEQLATRVAADWVTDHYDDDHDDDDDDKERSRDRTSSV